MIFDVQHILYVTLPVLALTALVQIYLKSTYSQYSQVESSRGLTGAEAARQILERGGVRDVAVEEVRGFLSDHYDPREKVLRLSPTNYSGRSIAAIGVSAHEAGHALQHAQNYAPLALRNLAVPLASLGSSLGYIALIIGFFMQFKFLALAGFLLLCGLLLFQLVNLPVEFNASRRALVCISDSGILTADENRGARKVLVAAALTYVAAMIAILWELVFWAIRLGLLGGNRN